VASTAIGGATSSRGREQAGRWTCRGYAGGGRALKELGIPMIPAYSPQARERSERGCGTGQGRFPPQLRLADPGGEGGQPHSDLRSGDEAEVQRGGGKGLNPTEKRQTRTDYGLRKTRTT